MDGDGSDDLHERRATDPAYLSAIEAVRDEVAALRDDMREDARELRAELRSSIDAFAVTHAKEHVTEHDYLQGLLLSANTAHERFEMFIRNAELAQARRDGYLGVFRFTVELLGRYYRPIGALIIALGFTAAALVGAISINIGIR